MMGGIMNIGGDVGQGTLSGAVGGVTAEMVMEAISQDALKRIRGHQQSAARAGKPFIAREALNYVLDKNPGLKLWIGTLVDTLILAAEKFEASLLGQGIAKVEGQLTKAEQNVATKLGFGKAESETAQKNIQLVEKDGARSASNS